MQYAQLTFEIICDIISVQKGKEMITMATELKRFWIHWGEGNISCFRLKSMTQALSIAMDYENVTKVEMKTDDE